MYAGLTVIRNDDNLFNKMNEIQDKYPMFDNKAFRKRLFFSLPVIFFTNTAQGYNALRLASKVYGMSTEELYVSMSRGFKPGEDFITRFRLKPCAALIHFLNERLEDFDYNEFDTNMRKY